MKQCNEDLKYIINELYDQPLNAKEVEEACNNLLNLFKELFEIDKEVNKK